MSTRKDINELAIQSFTCGLSSAHRQEAAPQREAESGWKHLEILQQLEERVPAIFYCRVWSCEDIPMEGLLFTPAKVSRAAAAR